MRPQTEVDRFWSKSHSEDRGYETPCWVWDGYKNAGCYGKFHLARPDNRSVQAHRYAFALAEGEDYLHSSIEERERELDHLCRQNDCVRPSHLEDVTQEVNLQRMHDALRTTFCKPGKHLRSENEKVDKLGRSFCGGCAREADARRRERKRVNV